MEYDNAAKFLQRKKHEIRGDYAPLGRPTSNQLSKIDCSSLHRMYDLLESWKNTIQKIKLDCSCYIGEIFVNELLSIWTKLLLIEQEFAGTPQN